MPLCLVLEFKVDDGVLCERICGRLVKKLNLILIEVDTYTIMYL